MGSHSTDKWECENARPLTRTKWTCVRPAQNRVRILAAVLELEQRQRQRQLLVVPRRQQLLQPLAPMTTAIAAAIGANGFRWLLLHHHLHLQRWEELPCR
jgi:hypothetical protein